MAIEWSIDGHGDTVADFVVDDVPFAVSFNSPPHEQLIPHFMTEVLFAQGRSIDLQQWTDEDFLQKPTTIGTTLRAKRLICEAISTFIEKNDPKFLACSFEERRTVVYARLLQDVAAITGRSLKVLQHKSGKRIAIISKG